MPKVNCSCYHGECSHCGGTGKQAFSTINEGFCGEPLYCNYCHGSKKCQECGGTGKVWEDPPERPEENNKPSSSGGSSGDYGGGESSGSSSSGGGGFGKFILGALALLFLPAMCTALFNNHSVAPVGQNQSQVEAKREVERQRIEMEKAKREQEDLPAGLKASDTNYSIIQTCAGMPPAPCIEINHLDSNRKYHLYTKDNSSYASWKEEEIERVYIMHLQGGDKLYRLYFYIKNQLLSYGKIVLIWNTDVSPTKNNESQVPAERTAPQEQTQQAFNEFLVELSYVPPNSRITLTQAEVTLSSGELRQPRVSNIELRGNAVIIRTMDYYPVGSRINCKFDFQPLMQNPQRRRF